MKTIKYLAIAMLSFTLVNCSTDDKGERAYGGSANVNFLNQGQAKNVFVLAESGFTDTVIEIGTLAAVSGTHTVTLVPDAANSTAVEGVDYEILTPTDELSNGESTGSFTVRFFEEGASQEAKTVVFTLQSATLPNTTYNNIQIVNVSLTCPIETFIGQFESNTYWTGPSVNEISLDDSDNTMKIEGFFTDNNTDLIFSYDPNTYVVTVPQQQTGFFYQGNPNQEVYARPSVAAGLVSSFNPCSRVLTLHINYWVPGVGSFGDKVEVFTGI